MAVGLATSVVALAAGLPVASAADPKPTAKELWQSYPLTEPQTTSPPPQTASPPPAATSPRRPSTRFEDATDSGGSTWMVVPAALVLLAAAATTVAIARRRRRHDRVRNETRPMTDRDIDVGASVGNPRTSLLYAGRPPDPDQHWLAEIVWDQGDHDAVFRAVARSDDTPDAVVARSGTLEWPPSGTSAVQEMRDAVEDLEATLVRVGWSAAGRGRAWYAKRFAWEPVPLHSTPAPPPVAVPSTPAPPPVPVPSTPAPLPVTPEDFEARWRCEIHWASGYVNLVVVRYAPGERGGVALRTSQDFRWIFKDEPDPRLSGDRDAVRKLCEALVATGWQPAGRGRTWYAHRFIWPSDSEPPDRLDLVPEALNEETTHEERRVATRRSS